MSTEQWKNENQDKVRGYRRDWYARNKEHSMDKVKNRRKELQEWVASIKSQMSCSQCGEGHVACLDFHHECSDKKEISISNAAKNGWSRERISKEIEKCVVLCANCHRKLHWQEHEIS